MTIQRFLVENYGPDLEAAKLILRESIQKAEELGAKTVTLLVSVKGTFPSTVFGELVGEKAANALCKGEDLKITDNVSLNLIIPKQVSPFGNYGVVVGVYLSQADLNSLDSIKSAQAISYIPWIDEEGKVWQSTWAPTVWGKSTWNAQPVQLNREVENELQRLTKSINLSTGLAHPSDKNNAKRTVKEIKVIDPTLSAEEVRLWAVKNGWDPRHAETLAKLMR